MSTVTGIRWIKIFGHTFAWEVRRTRKRRRTFIPLP